MRGRDWTAYSCPNLHSAASHLLGLWTSCVTHHNKCVRQHGEAQKRESQSTHAEKSPAKPSADHADCAVETVAENTCHDRTFEDRLALEHPHALLQSAERGTLGASAANHQARRLQPKSMQSQQIEH